MTYKTGRALRLPALIFLCYMPGPAHSGVKPFCSGNFHASVDPNTPLEKIVPVSKWVHDYGSSVDSPMLAVNNRTGVVLLYDDTGMGASYDGISFQVDFPVTDSHCSGRICTFNNYTLPPNSQLILGQVSKIMVPYHVDSITPSCGTSTILINPTATCTSVVSPPNYTGTMNVNETISTDFVVQIKCTGSVPKLKIAVTGYDAPNAYFTTSLSEPAAGASSSGPYNLSCTNSSTCTKTLTATFRSGATAGKGHTVLTISTYSG